MTALIAIWLAWPIGVLAVRMITRPKPADDAVTVYATVAMFGILTWVGYIVVTLLLAWVLGADTAGTDIDWSLAHVLAALLAIIAVTPISWRVGGARF